MRASCASYAARASSSLFTCATPCADGCHSLDCVGCVEHDRLADCVPVYCGHVRRMGGLGTWAPRLLRLRTGLSVSSHAVVAMVYHIDGLRKGLPGGHHRHRSPAAGTVGTDAGHRDLVSDHHQAAYGNGACNLHALGAAACAVEPGIRADCRVLE